MKRSWFIVIAGALLGLAVYWGTYRAGTRSMQSLSAGPPPELLWLKHEFQLPESEFERISTMHRSYLEGCAERCREIDQKNLHLKHLLANANAITPEIESLLAETARLRAECQMKMLAHFYAVSRSMPAEQGKRYLAWVQERTVITDTHSGMQHDAPSEAAAGSGTHHH
jgi:hypothetical protein